MAYSTPASLASGNTLTATHMNLLRTDFEATAKPPQIQAYNTVNQSIPNGTVTQMTLAGTYSVRDITLSSSNLTVAEGGYYIAVVNAGWATNAVGIRIIRWLLNGVVAVEEHYEPATTAWQYQTLTWFGGIATTDTARVEFYQTSGGALNLLAGSKVSLCMLSRV